MFDVILTTLSHVVANQYAPVLYKNNTILAHTGGYSTITQDMLMTSDKDTPFDKLKFRIIKPPANGNLMKVVDGKDDIMLANAVFSPKELIEGRIRFHHDALKPLEGEMFFDAGTVHYQPSYSLYFCWLMI